MTIDKLVLQLNRFTAFMLLVACRVTLRQIGRLGAMFALGLLNDYCIGRRLITIVSMKLNHFHGNIYNMIQKDFYVSYSKIFEPFLGFFLVSSSWRFSQLLHCTTAYLCETASQRGALFLRWNFTRFRPLILRTSAIL